MSNDRNSYAARYHPVPVNLGGEFCNDIGVTFLLLMIWPAALQLAELGHKVNRMLSVTEEESVHVRLAALIHHRIA
jgi:hypothetical protein